MLSSNSIVSAAGVTLSGTITKENGECTVSCRPGMFVFNAELTATINGGPKTVTKYSEDWKNN
jgi:hypothetical protein